MASEKCKHDLCVCAAKPEADYCSDHCKDAVDQDLTEIKCDCGHTHCGA